MICTFPSKKKNPCTLPPYSRGFDSMQTLPTTSKQLKLAHLVIMTWGLHCKVTDLDLRDSHSSRTYKKETITGHYETGHCKELSNRELKLHVHNLKRAERPSGIPTRRLQGKISHELAEAISYRNSGRESESVKRTLKVINPGFASILTLRFKKSHADISGAASFQEIKCCYCSQFHTSPKEPVFPCILNWGHWNEFFFLTKRSKIMGWVRQHNIISKIHEPGPNYMTLIVPECVVHSGQPCRYDHSGYMHFHDRIIIDQINTSFGELSLFLSALSINMSS
jgi:hypothetical protein